MAHHVSAFAASRRHIAFRAAACLFLSMATAGCGGGKKVIGTGSSASPGGISPQGTLAVSGVAKLDVGGDQSGILVTLELLPDGQAARVTGAARGARAEERKTFTTRTDGNGNFSLAGLPPGVYVATAEKDGRKKVLGNVDVNTQTVKDLKLEMVLAPTGTIGGQVTDHTGIGLSGALVFVPGTAFVAVTGASGRFTLDGIPAGTWALVAQKEGASAGAEGVIVAGTAAVAAPTLTLTFPSASKVMFSGTVTDKGNTPVQGAKVRLLGTILSAATGATGAFSLSNVPGGVYAVMVDSPGGGLADRLIPAMDLSSSLTGNGIRLNRPPTATVVARYSTQAGRPLALSSAAGVDAVVYALDGAQTARVELTLGNRTGDPTDPDGHPLTWRVSPPAGWTAAEQVIKGGYRTVVLEKISPTAGEATGTIVALDEEGAEGPPFVLTLRVAAPDSAATAAANAKVAEAKALMYKAAPTQADVIAARAKLDEALVQAPSHPEALVLRGLVEVALSADEAADALDILSQSFLPRPVGATLALPFGAVSAHLTPVVGLAVSGGGVPARAAASFRNATVISTSEITGAQMQTQLENNILPALTATRERLTAALAAVEGQPGSWHMTVPKDIAHPSLGVYAIQREEILLLLGVAETLEGLGTWITAWNLTTPGGEGVVAYWRGFTPVDTDGDGLFQPSEYLPPEPFLTIRNGKSGAPAQAKSHFTSGMDRIGRAIDGLVSRALDPQVGLPTESPYRQDAGLIRDVFNQAWALVKRPAMLPAYWSCGPLASRDSVLWYGETGKTSSLENFLTCLVSTQKVIPTDFPALLAATDLRRILPTIGKKHSNTALLAPVSLGFNDVKFWILADSNGNMKASDPTLGGVFPDGLNQKWFFIEDSVFVPFPFTTPLTYQLSVVLSEDYTDRYGNHPSTLLVAVCEVIEWSIQNNYYTCESPHGLFLNPNMFSDGSGNPIEVVKMDGSSPNLSGSIYSLNVSDTLAGTNFPVTLFEGFKFSMNGQLLVFNKFSQSGEQRPKEVQVNILFPNIMTLEVPGYKPVNYLTDRRGNRLAGEWPMKLIPETVP